MKTQKTLLASLLIVALLLTSNGIAQETEKKTYGMAEISYMLPKIGMEKAFVSAVNAHNEKYHKEGPYKAYIDNVLTGNETGWFVWVMGPCTFTDLDSRPGKGEHTDDWSKNIAPTIRKYGRTEYWRYNAKLSYQSDATEPKYEALWFVDLKRGDYYRFKALMSKIQEAYAKKGDGNISVYNNSFVSNDGREVAIVWDYGSWSDFDDEGRGIKKDFEEINGEGSWDNMLDEWEEITESIVREVWEHNVK
jgi:hypothetical protein